MSELLLAIITEARFHVPDCQPNHQPDYPALVWKEGFVES